jgi:hypothetical protein
MHGKHLKQKALQAVRKSNKICKLVFFILLICSNCCMAQKNKSLSSVKMYLVNWDARYTLPMTINNIKENNEYYFETDGTDFSELFESYLDLITFLEKNIKIEDKKDISAQACVEFCFGKKIVSLFFIGSGEFYYNGSWYNMNAELYYKLFCHFSNRIMPEKTLIKANNIINNQ